MFKQIAALENAYEQARSWQQFPNRPNAELLEIGEQWSEAVWSVAEKVGPFPLEEAQLRQGLRLAQRPVFVCGTHRSGSTLVRDLLDGHPALSVLPSEGSYLTSLSARLAPLPAADKLRHLGKEWLRRLANPTARPPSWLLGRTRRAESPYVRFARLLIAWWSASRLSFGRQRQLWPLIAVALAYASDRGQRGDTGTGALRWVDKTPTNEFYLSRLWGALPDAKVVHVVRNPLAVYASRKRIEEGTLGVFPGARKALADLALSLRIAVQERSRGNQTAYLMIRYEDLLAAPQEVMERLAAFLEIEPMPSLLKPTVTGVPVTPNSSFMSNQPAGVVVSTNRGVPQGVLTRSEQATVAAYTATFAAPLGYPLPPQPPIRRHLQRCRFLLGHALRRARRRAFSAQDVHPMP